MINGILFPESELTMNGSLSIDALVIVISEDL